MPKSRSSRALENDNDLRIATINLILKNGVDAISFRDVGREAGLTHGALYARFEDVEELLVDLWSATLQSRAASMMDAVVDAVAHPSTQTVGVLIDRMRFPLPEDSAMTQVLLTSRRMVVLKEEVDGFVRESLMADGGLTPQLHVRAVTIFAWMLAEILAVEQFGADETRMDFLALVLLNALTVEPSTVDDVALIEPTDRIIPRPESDLQSRLMYYTFSSVGTSGYARATISRISRRAQSSPGAIYKVYTSKEELVIGAIRTLMRAPWISVVTLADILGVGGLAQHWHSSASEQNAMRKNFTLEIAITCGYNATLRSAVSTQLRGLELLVPMLQVSDDDKNRLRNTIRTIVMSTLGVSFLSTVSPDVGKMDLNQFAEPFRRAILEQFPGWNEIRRQLIDLAFSPPATTPVAERSTNN